MSTFRAKQLLRQAADNSQKGSAHLFKVLAIKTTLSLAFGKVPGIWEHWLEGRGSWIRIMGDFLPRNGRTNAPCLLRVASCHANLNLISFTQWQYSGWMRRHLIFSRSCQSRLATQWQSVPNIDSTKHWQYGHIRMRAVVTTTYWSVWLGLAYVLIGLQYMSGVLKCLRYQIS